MYLCMYVFIYLFIYLCMYVFIYLFIYVFMYLFLLLILYIFSKDKFLFLFLYINDLYQQVINLNYYKKIISVI